MLAIRLCRRQLVASINSLGSLRTFSAVPAPAAEEDDLVLSAFKEQQHQYRALVEGMKKLSPPLGGNEAAVKKYADDMEALRKKVGMPDYGEVADAVLDFKLKAADGDVRSFLNAALEGRSDASGALEGMEEALFAAIDAVEAEFGPLAAGNAAAFQSLTKHIEAIEVKRGLKAYDAVKGNKEAIYELYTEQLATLKMKAAEDMETIKRKDGLEFVTIDPATLKAAAV